METKTTSLPYPKPATKGKPLRFLFLSLIAGMGITCFSIFLIKIGLFERWTYINRIPDKTVELIGGDPWTVFIRSSENNILSCSGQNSDECWIPDVATNLFPSQPCEKNLIAFLPISNAPRNVIYCKQIKGSYIEGSFEVIYAIEPDGKLWRWGIDNSSFEIIVLPFLIIAGGLGGTLIGSMIWVVKEIALIKQHFSERPLISKSHLALLAIPWLCLLSIFVFWFFFLYRPSNKTNSKNSEIFSLSTAVAGTVTVQMEEISKKWLIEVTPGVGSLRYSFTENYCSAKWTSGWNTLPCYETNNSSSLLISRLSNPEINGMVQTGDALWVRLTPIQYVIIGEYPTMEIQEGDHFRMMVGCTDGSQFCDMVFDISYETQDKGKILLGRWNPNRDNQMEEIDIDLSILAGQKVRFYLSSYDPKNTANNQGLVLLRPRIEK